MTIIVDLKKTLLDCGVTLTDVAGALSKKYNKPYSIQNLSNKLKRETITHREMIAIADILGYDIKFIRRKEKKGNEY